MNSQLNSTKFVYRKARELKLKDRSARRHKEDNYSEMNMEENMRFWRKKICDSIYYFLSIFGFIAFIPSFYLSLKESLYGVALIDTLVYIAVIIITFNKKIGYKTRAFVGSALFYALGLFLIVILGPIGAGNLWLFAFTLITGLTLGEKASVISLIINTITQIAIYLLLHLEILRYDFFVGNTADAWLIRGANFIILNLIIVISHIIFVKGFKYLLKRSNETKKATIIGLARLAEHRDSETGEHLNRIQYYTTIIAAGLAEETGFSDYITQTYINDISLSSTLHDIGKVGIQDSILLKPGPLTNEEFEQIKQHTIYGGDVIREIENNIEGRSLYQLAREIAYYHHEKWDGSGYPEGLSERTIPLSARIVALVDVYDALTSNRPYKKAYSHEKAREIIIAQKAKHFDPLIVNVFVRREEDFIRLNSVVQQEESVYS